MREPRSICRRSICRRSKIELFEERLALSAQSIGSPLLGDATEQGIERQYGELAPVEGPPVQIIDNGAVGFSTNSAWSYYGGAGHEGDIHYSSAGNGSKVATWTFDVNPGVYRVSGTWLPHANRATDAPYTILDGSQVVGQIDINQEQLTSDVVDAGTSWQDLGQFNILSDSLVVQLTNQANQYVIVDAIRIERVSTAQSLNTAASGLGQASQNTELMTNYEQTLHFTGQDSGFGSRYGAEDGTAVTRRLVAAETQPHWANRFLTDNVLRTDRNQATDEFFRQRIAGAVSRTIVHLDGDNWNGPIVRKLELVVVDHLFDEFANSAL
jgi:hypothetical protein